MNYIDRILGEVGAETILRVDSAINRGYALASDVIGSIDFLKAPSALNFKQNLYNVAVDHVIAEMTQRGIIPGKAVFLPNAKRNSFFLKLEIGKTVFTFSSCNGGSLITMPRPALFRGGMASGQTYLDDQGSICFDSPQDNYLYAIFCHRKEFDNKVVKPYIYLGVPDQEYFNWLESRAVNDIIDRAIALVEPVDTAEDIALNVSLKKGIERKLKEI